jgi:hypothetical protein
VSDVFMCVGLWSHSETQFAHPIVPDSMINTHQPGYVLLHAYTVFGSLKLTGEYYGFSREFITPYYHEVERILRFVGSNTGGSEEEVRVGEVFKL